MTKLNQIIAVEKQVKNASHKTITDCHRRSQKPELFAGFSKQWEPLSEDSEVFPPEEKRVQVYAEDNIDLFRGALAEQIDTEASRDYGNMRACSDVLIDGAPILEGAPVPLLLSLEKHLNDVETFVRQQPTLDTADEWNPDPNTGGFRSRSVRTHRPKKIVRAIVKYDATPEHPAQTDLITEDQIIGHWLTTKFSGAQPRPRKQALIARVQQLKRAVKYAREQANSIDVEEKRVGENLLDWLFRKE